MGRTQVQAVHELADGPLRLLQRCVIMKLPLPFQQFAQNGDAVRAKVVPIQQIGVGSTGIRRIYRFFRSFPGALVSAAQRFGLEAQPFR